MILRPITEDDFPRVSEFLAAPHVARWWHDDPSLKAVRERYLPNVTGTDPTHVLIAEVDDEPVGLCQWYLWDDYAEGRAAYGIPAGTVGIDYLVGEAFYCERGHGTAMIAALVDATQPYDVWVTPEAANEPSRRVLEKNDFELMAEKQCHVPDEPWAGPTALYRFSR